jgi:transcriptional regulator of acetoin/glycerol metabolism
MERAAALARRSRVGLEDLPEEIRRASPRPLAIEGTVKPLRQIEKAYILEILERNGGNQTRTAEQLRIGSATLYRKLKKYGVIGVSPAARGGAGEESA